MKEIHTKFQFIQFLLLVIVTTTTLFRTVDFSTNCGIRKNDSYENTNRNPPPSDLDEESNCKIKDYTKIAYILIILTLLLIMQIYLLYSISKGKLHLLTVFYSIILTLLYFMAVGAASAGQGAQSILDHIYYYWAVYNNTLFSLYIIIYYVFFRNK